MKVIKREGGRDEIAAQEKRGKYVREEKQP